jgi:hypothetical protein
MLFDKIYLDNMQLDKFKELFFEMFDQNIKNQITEVYFTDKLDVLKNLYWYCKNKKHKILNIGYQRN